MPCLQGGGPCRRGVRGRLKKQNNASWGVSVGAPRVDRTVRFGTLPPIIGISCEQRVATEHRDTITVEASTLLRCPTILLADFWCKQGRFCQGPPFCTQKPRSA
eukprot:8801418-Alexandrium_andersonii.AAC.1